TEGRPSQQASHRERALSARVPERPHTNRRTARRMTGAVEGSRARASKHCRVHWSVDSDLGHPPVEDRLSILLERRPESDLKTIDPLIVSEQLLDERPSVACRDEGLFLDETGFGVD